MGTSEQLVYREEQGVWLIEIRLRALEQLFNSLDPTPFPGKDLDADAEEYIVGAVAEVPPEKKVRLVIYLPAGGATNRAAIGDTIHTYFRYREQGAIRELRQERRETRWFIVVGLAFLAACLLLRQFVLGLGGGPAVQIVAEGLLILGWVGMWRPLEAVLYNWWPPLRRRRLFRRLSTIDVELRHY